MMSCSTDQFLSHPQLRGPASVRDPRVTLGPCVWVHGTACNPSWSSIQDLSWSSLNPRSATVEHHCRKFGDTCL